MTGHCTWHETTQHANHDPPSVVGFGASSDYFLQSFCATLMLRLLPQSSLSLCDHRNILVTASGSGPLTRFWFGGYATSLKHKAYSNSSAFAGRLD